MKKICILLLFLCVAYSTSARKIPGYIITAEGQKTEVILKVPFMLFGQPNFERLQRKVRYYDTNNKRQVLRPSQAHEISFSYKDKTYRMLSRQFDNPLAKLFTRDGYFFLHLVKDGKLKLFRYYETRRSGGSMGRTGVSGMNSMGMSSHGTTYSVQKYLLQKNDEPLFRTNFLTFKKDMAEYLKECEDVVKKINDKEYRNRDMEELVEEYNTKCN